MEAHGTEPGVPELDYLKSECIDRDAKFEEIRRFCKQNPNTGRGGKSCSVSPVARGNERLAVRAFMWVLIQGAGDKCKVGKSSR